MNRTHAAVALAAGLLLATGCNSQPTYDESVQACIKAIKARPADDKAKPKPCEPLKEDDYTILVGSKVIDDLGWIDENGNVDVNKMLRSTPSP
ncbi:hypothetical protein ACFWG6_31015 [Streptomyces erythrochromogenes]|uniref:hypothetical protein n=1 Tax=Streptomyces erythrochromogenes TaxID=285574 RepID=UPI0036405455